MNDLRLLSLFLAGLVFSARMMLAADIYIGSGCKAGEMTDRSAIVLVRLTTTPGQDANGNIPGREGEARLRYAADETLQSPQMTSWQRANP